MDFSLHELRAFIEVAEQGNISSAARQIGLTQPALSFSIKKMEDALGVDLFLRSKKGVHLTRAGETLLLRSRDLMRSFQQLKDAINANEQEVRGIYTLGVHGTIATYILPRFYPGLLTENPDVELRLVHDLSRNIADGVIRFKTDFGIVVDPPKHPDLVIVPLYRDEFKFWVCDQPSALADCSKPHGLVACNPQLLRTATLMREATRTGLVHGNARVLHTSELELIAHLVAGGHAAGVLPATIAKGRPGPPLVGMRDSPVFRDLICLIYRHDTVLSKAAGVIRDYIVGHLRGENPPGL